LYSIVSLHQRLHRRLPRARTLHRHVVVMHRWCIVHRAWCIDVLHRRRASWVGIDNKHRGRRALAVIDVVHCKSSASTRRVSDWRLHRTKVCIDHALCTVHDALTFCIESAWASFINILHRGVDSCIDASSCLYDIGLVLLSTKEDWWVTVCYA